MLEKFLNDPADIVEARWTARASVDLFGILAHVADDIRLRIHVPQHVWFFAGESSGKAAYRDRLKTFLDHFEPLHFSGTVMSVQRNTVRGQARFAIRHRKTGQVLEGVQRQVAAVAGGQITAIDEYHDVARVQAFMQLAALSRTA